MGRHLRSLSLVLAICALASLATPAQAQSTVKSPGQRTHYYFEAEPHALLGLFDPPGFGGDTGWGVGFRGAVDIVSDGFLGKINDSVALGFGVDYLRYDGWQGPRGQCLEFTSAPSGVPVCVRASGSGLSHVDYFYVPVVMQWNFWLHERWSVFGEPGLAMYFQEGDLELQPIVLYVGGRFHFSDRITLTMRLGYPTFSLGASFLL